MKIMVINGPNINMLGIREPDIYGTGTYADLCRDIDEFAEENDLDVVIYQSNHEGEIVDIIQAAYGICDGIVINAGGFTHSSVAILDALKAVNIPAVEVHISDLTKRESFRQISYLRSACEETIMGHGFKGYLEAMEYLMKRGN